MPNSTTATESYYQDQLSRDPRFVRRLQQHMMRYALQVKAEGAGIPNHTVRLTYARSVIANPEDSANRAAFVVVNAVGIQGTIIINDGAVSTSINDGTFFTQVGSMWDTLAGVET